jgi:peptidylprolyl isomerase
MMRSLSSRRMAPVVVLVSAALLVSGCGGGSKKASDTPSKPAAKGSCDYKAGKVSDAVKVSGDFGKDVTADFKSGLKATGVQRTIVTKGDGAKTAKNDQLNVVITVFLGSTGKKVTSSPTTFKVGDTTLPAAFDSGISCVPIGSRVVSTVPAKDVVGDSGNANLGIKATDTLVIATDVVSKVEPAKIPTPAAWTDAPTVTFTKAGKPTVKLTGKPDPALKLKVLRAGTGAVVGRGDTVTVNYQGTSWNLNKIFDSSYAAGRSPTPLTADVGQGGVVPGFAAALIGQKVGARLIVTMPPKDAYGVGKIVKYDASNPNLIGQTLVFVIEIQNTTPPS